MMVQELDHSSEDRWKKRNQKMKERNHLELTGKKKKKKLLRMGRERFCEPQPPFLFGDGLLFVPLD